MSVLRTEGVLENRLKYRQEHFKERLFEYGLSCIPGKANEDAYSIYLHNENNVAFGVFDGHGGSFGSRLCAKAFSKSVLDLTDQMMDRYCGSVLNDNESPNPDLVFDALFCESIRQATDAISREIKKQGKTGTTCSSLFLQFQRDQRTKVWCANTGDSRCIMIRGEEAIYMSDDHSLTLPRERERIMKKKLPEWFPLPASPHKMFKNKEMDILSKDSADKKKGKDIGVRDAYPSQQQLQSARLIVKSVCEKDAVNAEPKQAKSNMATVGNDSVTEEEKDDDRRVQQIEDIDVITIKGLGESVDAMDCTVHNTVLPSPNESPPLTKRSLERNLDQKLQSKFSTELDAMNSKFTETPEFDLSSHDEQQKAVEVGSVAGSVASSAFHHSIRSGGSDPSSLSFNAKEIVRILVQETYRIFEADKVSFWRPGKDSKSGDAILCCVISQDIVGVELKADEGLVGRCFTTKAIVYGANVEKTIKSISGDGDERRVFAEVVNPRERVTVPLIDHTDGTVIGVLQAVQRTNGEPYSLQDVSQLSSMCVQTARAIVAYKESKKRLSEVDKVQLARRISGKDLKPSASSTPESSTITVQGAGSLAQPTVATRGTGAAPPPPPSRVGGGAPGDEKGVMLVYQNSFVAHRVSADGKVFGPLALFSRYNVSITMTRSLGDKFVARSCVSIPEVTTLVLEADQHARFIVASDGLWDVVTIEEAREAVRRINDPVRASLVLAYKARLRREEASMKIDDIAVIVVDVNPHSRPEIPQGCGCTIS